MGGLKSVCPEDWKANGFPFRTEKGSVETKAFYNISLVGGRIFLGTMTDGLVEFNPQTATFRPYVDVGCSVISSLSTDGKDRLYVGTDGNGVHFISVSEGRIVRSFRHEPRDKTTIRSNSVYSVLVDREGLLWIGFYQLGVDYSICRNSLFHVYRYGTTFTTEDIPVRTVAFHGNQRLIGSRDGFVFIDEAAGQFKVFKAPQLRAGIILSSCYFEGNFYIGTYGGGMYVLNSHTLELEDFNLGDSYPFRSGHIFCIRPDADGCLWVGTSDGVYCFRNGKKIRHLTSAGTKLPDGNVYEIFFDSSLKGWICTENGLCIWDPSTNSLKTNVFPEGFVDKEKIRMVYETSDRKLLFLPEKGELFVSDLSLRNYGYVERGTLLSGKNLMSVVEDDGGALWITTNNGIYRYAKEEGIIPFGIADGVPSSIFINCYAVKDETGTLWFGNSRGLVYLPGGDVHRIPHSPYPMDVSELLDYVLERPDLLERSGTHYVLSLDASIRSVTVQLPDGVFTYPGGAIYEYRREGESGWTPVMGGAEICFSGLSGKDCRYYVRRAGFPDSVMTLDMHFPFSRFWLWAGLSAVLLVLGGSVLIYRKKSLGPSQSVSSEDVSGGAFYVPPVAESGEDETEPAVALPEEVEVAEHPVEERTERHGHHLRPPCPRANPPLGRLCPATQDKVGNTLYIEGQHRVPQSDGISDKHTPVLPVLRSLRPLCTPISQSQRRLHRSDTRARGKGIVHQRPERRTAKAWYIHTEIAQRGCPRRVFASHLGHRPGKHLRPDLGQQPDAHQVVAAAHPPGTQQSRGTHPPLRLPRMADLHAGPPGDVLRT